jgi:hypothetical protein
LIGNDETSEHVGDWRNNCEESNTQDDRGFHKKRKIIYFKPTQYRNFFKFANVFFLIFDNKKEILTINEYFIINFFFMSFKETFEQYRNSKNARLIFLGFLILIVLGLLFFWGKAKGMLIAILVILLVAVGLQVADYDLDLGKLWETGGNIEESRVMQKDGLKVFGSQCITNNLNCDNFKTQAEAQAKYDTCADQIVRDNGSSKEKVRSIDIFGLDKDKDGMVCEALPKWLNVAQ